MYGGIIPGTGRVVAVEPAEGAALRLAVDVSVLGRTPRRGDSISIDGACLTVVEYADGVARFDVVGETVRRTTLGALARGDAVNLEGSLRVGDEIGGHQVSGHIDAVGEVRAVERRPDETWMTIAAPPAALDTLAPKGWVAVSGASLTVADVDAVAGTFSVALIPTTLALTTLGDAAVGTRVNVEGDPIGRHVARFLASRSA